MDVRSRLPDRGPRFEDLASTTERRIDEGSLSEQGRDIRLDRRRHKGRDRIELHFDRHDRRERQPEQGEQTDRSNADERRAACEPMRRNIAQTFIDVVETVLQAGHEIVRRLLGREVCEQLAARSQHPIVSGAAGARRNVFTKLGFLFGAQGAVTVVRVFL